ncbi:hypothetical protein PPERSA_09019 [Pseudocohnilembus persalinus]|uniref:Uncharacterized protein n=1 Tax=Pseudocohnilembus persalinus TaxID=266149 RepID=A0A0V0R318_PSEPJ|nr:hypothetical protein PPERSA_09019 [Pseudocohnilembus persalinus]|eukprot:KRX08915.1 hypothetical protein PPERSA_09019 [Pseudocohnilembus persalinus]
MKYRLKLLREQKLPKTDQNENENEIERPNSDDNRSDYGESKQGKGQNQDIEMDIEIQDELEESKLIEEENDFTQKLNKNDSIEKENLSRSQSKADLLAEVVTEKEEKAEVEVEVKNILQ